MNLRALVFVTVLFGAARDAAAAGPLSYGDLKLFCDKQNPTLTVACTQTADVAQVDLVCSGRATPAQVEAALALSCVAFPGGAPVNFVPSSANLPWVSILTDFFVARAKAELMLFLKNRIQGSVCASDTPGEILLPETCKLLDGEASGLTGFPTALRRDLAELPAHLVELGWTLIDAAKIPPAAKSAICVLDIVGRAYPKLRDLGPEAGLHDIATLTPHAGCETDTAVHRVRFGAATLKFLISDVVPTLKTTPLDRVALLNTIKLFLASAKGTYGANDADVAAIATRLETAIGKLEVVLAQLGKLAELNLHDPTQIARMLDTLADLVGAFLPPGDTSGAVTMFRATTAFSSGRYTAGLLRLGTIQAVESWLEQHPKLGKTWSGIVKFAGVVGSLAEAENEDDARAILENAASPVGSYRDFRQGGWAAFISGYAGLAAGFEGGGDVGGDATFAPLLPVGLEFGHPLCKHSSINIMVSVLDLGAIAATRLTTSDSESMGMDGGVRRSAEKDLAGVLAPGLFVSIGLGDSPFLIGLGGEYLPASRAVFECPGMECSATRTEPVFRGMLFVGLDLPVFPIYR